MTVRYRIRTSAGQELSFASREMFEKFVRSGDLSPDDLVYDGETGSWSPARTHPLVLDIQYALDAAEEAAEAERGLQAPSSGRVDDVGAETGAPEVGPASPSPHTDESPGPEAPADGGAPEVDLNFDLVLAEEVSPEEEKRAFLEQLEAERESAIDAGPSLKDSLAGFTVDAETLASRSERTPPPSPPPPRTPDPPARPRRPRGAGHPAMRGGDRSRPDRTGPDAEGPTSGGLRRLFGVLLLVGLVAAGGYVGFRLLAAADTPGSESPAATIEPVPDPVDERPDPDPEEREVEPEPAPEPVIASTPAAVRERAQERYLTATQNALRDLRPIPEIWPQGPYLAVPSDYPEVVDIWQDYRSTIRAVRQSDTDRYRSAYEAALDDAAVVGEARQERLDTAMSAFATGRELRQAHFDRVETLATAAIQSHNALVESEGLILYDATGSTGRSDGIGRGTSGRNAESQLLLDQVVDLLEAALEADGQGPGTGENVREWVWDGFLDAATR